MLASPTLSPPTLSADQLDRYRKDGYVALGPVLDADEVAEIAAEERRLRLPVPYGGPDNPGLFVNIQLCHRSEPIRRVATAGAHLPAVAQLLGPDICLTHQQFVTKLPDTVDVAGEADTRSDVPWHQDDGYGRLEPMTDVTVWIPLVDTDARNGGLFVVPGSHRGGLLDHGQAGVNPVLLETRAPADPVAVPLRAGEGVAFSGLLLHGSGPNHGDVERPALFLRYCEPGSRMLSEGGRAVLEDPHSWMVAGQLRA